MSTRRPSATTPPCNWPSSRPSSSKGRPTPNPPVGAVILDRDGRVVGVGGTQRAGSAHAEVVALRRAGRLADGGTAVVTLEPCNHHGKTPPCVDALLESGVATVVYAVSDPNPAAAGGSARLAAAGIRVIGDVETDLVVTGSLREWLHKPAHRLAACDMEVRHQHRRAQRGRGRFEPVDHQRGRARRGAPAPGTADAIVVGTGTVLADDPALTARLPDGGLAERQPLRVVVGKREIPSEAKVLNDDSRTMVMRTREPAEVLQALSDRTDVLLEGGPTLAGAFLRGGGDRPHPRLHRADPVGRARSLRSTTSGCRASAGRCAGGTTAWSASVQT